MLPVVRDNASAKELADMDPATTTLPDPIFRFWESLNWVCVLAPRGIVQSSFPTSPAMATVSFTSLSIAFSNWEWVDAGNNVWSANAMVFAWVAENVSSLDWRSFCCCIITVTALLRLRCDDICGAVSINEENRILSSNLKLVDGHCQSLSKMFYCSFVWWAV